MKGFLNKVQNRVGNGAKTTETPSSEGKVARSDITIPRGSSRRY